MKLAIYTLCRDRLNYTQRTFKALKETAGIEYDHFVLDNGSMDGTKEWLIKHYIKDSHLKGLYLSPDNKGLWQGINIILKETNFFKDYDLVLKLDNDAEFPFNNWLKNLVRVYKDLGKGWILSPFIDGVCDGAGGAPRLGYIEKENYRIGRTLYVGGICLLTSAKNYTEMFPNLSKSQGWDVWFCTHAPCKCGYIESIRVRHMNTTEGQEKKNPKYYKRKIKESKEIYKGNIFDYENKIRNGKTEYIFKKV